MRGSHDHVAAGKKAEQHARDNLHSEKVQRPLRLNISNRQVQPLLEIGNTKMSSTAAA